MTKTKQAVILAAVQTKFGELYEYSLKDLAREAANRALQEAGLKVEELDLVVVTSMTAGYLSRQGNLGSWLTQVLGLACPVMVVEAACGGGGSALGVGLTFLKAREAKRVMVLGVEKLTDWETEEVAEAMMLAADWEEEGVTGLTFPGLNALVAERFFSERPDISREILAGVAMAAHERGVKNEWAHIRKKLAREEYGSAEWVAQPLRLYDCAPVSDGAAVVIIGSEPGKRKIRGEIGGWVQEMDLISLFRRESLTSMAATKRAMVKLVAKTGLKREEIKVLEVHDAFTILQPIALEDLGLEGRKDLTINPYGGLKAGGHPVAATGLRQIADLCRALKPGEWGLAQNMGGIGGVVTLTLVKGGDK